jgi:uncharacterized protein YgbK (DUF1537 family)
MAELAIIADDLTGALDAAAPFAMHGVSTCVALDLGGLPEALASGARVIGISTDSREIAPLAATEAVRHAVAALPAGIRLFKKVDSRLKGNIAAELDALPHERSLVVPAIPAFGRWMRNGHLGGFGVVAPIDIAERLGRHAEQAMIPNVETEADIDHALEADFDLPVGARSLAEAMAKRMAAPGEVSIAPPKTRVYCLIGSTDPITTEQVRRVITSHASAWHVSAPNGVAHIEPVDYRLVVIQATPGATMADGKTVAEALARSLQQLEPKDGSLLVLSGGATAQMVLQHLGIRTLELLGEAQPGLPIAKAGGLTVVTKSGGFGDPETLVRLLAPYSTLESDEHTYVG